MAQVKTAISTAAKIRISDEMRIGSRRRVAPPSSLARGSRCIADSARASEVCVETVKMRLMFAVSAPLDRGAGRSPMGFFASRFRPMETRGLGGCGHGQLGTRIAIISEYDII